MKIYNLRKYHYYLSKPIPNRPLWPARNTIKGRKQGRPPIFKRQSDYFEYLRKIIKLKPRPTGGEKRYEM